MSNFTTDKNAFSENMNLHDNINSNNNNNKMNSKINQKGSLPEHLIFFKEDVLKDIKQLESKLSLKYDSQFNLNSNKITKVETKMEQINQRIDYMSTSITNDNSLKERLDKIANSCSKLDESILLQDVRIKNVNNKLTETIDKFDKILSETVIYPAVIGPKRNYKTFHELIDQVLYNLNQLLMFREKINIEFREFKYKTDSIMSNFQIKLDYLTKNANAFTTSSIRISEKKMEQIIRSYVDEFRNEIDEFKNKYSSFTPEVKTTTIIEKDKKNENPSLAEENSKKIEILEKVIESFKEDNKKIKKEINKLTTMNENINLNLNNSINNSNIIYDKITPSPKKSYIEERNLNYQNEIKNATSIVRDYIKGKITENEMFPKRKSVNPAAFPDLESIKEFRNMYLKQNFAKKRKKSHIKSNKGKIGDGENSTIKSDDENIEEEEDDSESNSSSASIKEENKKVEKNYEFQKDLYGVSTSENDLIDRKKNYRKKRRSIKSSKFENNSANSALNYVKINRKVIQKRKGSTNNSLSNNSENNENKEKKPNQDSKINNNFYISKNMNNKNNNKNVRYYEDYKSKDNNNFNSIYEKSKKYDNIKDVKTIITIIKKESRDNLIPTIIKNKLMNQTSNSINNLRSKYIDNENNANSANNISNKNLININSRNKKDITLETSVKNYSKTKGDYSRIKLVNTPTPSKVLNQNNILGNSNLKLPAYDNKKLSKAISAGRLTAKNKWNDVNKININFKPYEENTQEKDEQNLSKILNQMKNFISNDEKALIKERFIKYGYDKDKLFINRNKRRYNEEDNHNYNGIPRKSNFIAQKCIVYEN